MRTGHKGRPIHNGRNDHRVPILRADLAIAQVAFRGLPLNAAGPELCFGISHPAAYRIPALPYATFSEPALTDYSTHSHAAGTRWSSAIAERFRLKLSPQWIDWFDHGIHAVDGLGEFSEPSDPADLLCDSPECIWPGLMLPDLLPILTNGVGDWLCGRIGADNTIHEVVYWFHGGGDFLPYGQDLAQAITFANLVSRFPWKSRAHAIAAHPAGPKNDWSSGISHWALQFLPSDFVSKLLSQHNSTSTELPWAELLSDHRIAWEAVQCERVLALIDNDLRRFLQPSQVSHLEFSWERDWVRWMFDPQSIPDAWLDRLPHCVIRGTELDDRWNQAGELSRQVTLQRPDLAWAWDVYGWSCQRRGDRDQAIDAYSRSAQTSVFSDQSIRFRTHFDSATAAKFSVARLIELEAGDRVDREYGAALTAVNQAGWRRAVTGYWNSQAAQASSAEQRYDWCYRGGWDVGCESMTDYHQQLNRLVIEAQASGQAARAEVAMTHLNCIEERYLLERR